MAYVFALAVGVLVGLAAGFLTGFAVFKRPERWCLDCGSRTGVPDGADVEQRSGARFLVKHQAEW